MSKKFLLSISVSLLLFLPFKSFSKSFISSTHPSSTIIHIGSSVNNKSTLEEKKEAQIKVFIVDNFDNLKIEMAQGEGASLDTLGGLYHLVNVSKWKSYLQKNYKSFFSLAYPIKALDFYENINIVTNQQFKKRKDIPPTLPFIHLAK